MNLEVEVVEAIIQKRSIDPYFILDCGETTCRRTRVLHNQTTYSWNDHFHMKPLGNSLHVSLYDKRRISSDKLLGTVTIPLSHFQGRLHEEWFLLTNGDKVYLRVKYLHSQPHDQTHNLPSHNLPLHNLPLHNLPLHNLPLHNLPSHNLQYQPQPQYHQPQYQPQYHQPQYQPQYHQPQYQPQPQYQQPPQYHLPQYQQPQQYQPYPY